MAGSGLTIFDIAREAGVSIATVSRALGDKFNPNSPKQRLVLEIARRHNYRPSAAARSLGTGQSRLLCIVLPEITNPYYSELFSHAEREASEHGYALILQNVRDDPREYERLVDQVIGYRPDGLILSGGMVEGPQSVEKLRILERLGQYMPIVILGSLVETFPCVCVSCDLAESARASVRHLHALGHTRIALLGGTPRNRSSGERGLGYSQEMTRLGLTEHFEYLRTAGYTAEDGASGLLKMLSGMERHKWPTALIGVNDLVALGALRQLRRMGLDVPGDMALVGCDNQFFAPYTHPPLTTVDLNMRKQGGLAVQYLLSPRAGIAFQHQIDSELIVRESCGARASGR